MSAKRKTPSKGTDPLRVTSIRLSEEQWERLRVVAFRERTSVGSQIRKLIDDGLEAHEEEAAA